MIDKLSITVLVDNKADRDGLLAEHGLSLWIECGRYRILFDVGQGKALEHNAAALGVDISTAAALVISHGHYDHTGNLGTVLQMVPGAAFYMHPDALQDKYARNSAPPHRDIGMQQPARLAVRSLGRAVNWTRSHTEIFPGAHLTGQIPRRNDVEDVGGAFFLDPDCRRPDPLLDDQALFFDTRDGVVVVLGCAHAGVANTLDYVSELSGRQRILAVIGGTHLVGGPLRRQEAIEALERYGVEKIAAGHCTGAEGTAALCSRFPDRCLPYAVGSVFRFGDAE